MHKRTLCSLLLAGTLLGAAMLPTGNAYSATNIEKVVKDKYKPIRTAYTGSGYELIQNQIKKI